MCDKQCLAAHLIQRLATPVAQVVVVWREVGWGVGGGRRGKERIVSSSVYVYEVSNKFINLR